MVLLGPGYGNRYRTADKFNMNPNDEDLIEQVSSRKESSHVYEISCSNRFSMDWPSQLIDARPCRVAERTRTRISV